MYDDEQYKPAMKSDGKFCFNCQHEYPCEYASSCRMVAGKPHYKKKPKTNGFHFSEAARYLGGRHRLTKRKIPFGLMK